MGRKSSAKTQARPGASATPPAEPPRSSTPILLAGAALILVIGGALIYQRSSGPSSQPAAQTAAMPAVVDPPESATHGPHPQENLPPLPFDPEPPARPMDVVRAAYKFAAEHPEVLSYVPCYCGCEHSGHRGNEDCFVTARDAKGDVTQWEPHGMT
jgi:hypothetical protein